MNEDDKQMTGQDSLAIIQQMISAAKQDQKDDGAGWILWGWLLFMSSLLTVANIHFGWFGTFFFWNIFGLIALLLLAASIIKKMVLRPAKKVRTYMKDVFDKLNIGFTLLLLLIILAMNVDVKPAIGFPLLTGLYAFWIMIYGALLNFKPSVIAAYVVFGLALSGMFVNSFQWVMALHALAALVGYIIPGHMAYNAFKKISAGNIKKGA